MKLSLGELLYRFRVERNLEAKQICKGICSASLMSYIENGERIPDTLMFESLTERMGISPEVFSLMITEEEYVYHEWKNNVWGAIEREEWEYLEELLCSPVTKETFCNEKLELQFYSYVNGIYLAYKEDYVGAIKALKQAAVQTQIDRFNQIKKDALLNLMELHILILYLFYGLKGKVLSIKQGQKLFFSLEDYIYNGSLDLNEKAKLYPKLVCVGAQCMENQLSDDQKIDLCERAIQLSIENKTFHDLTEVFCLYISLLEKTSSDKLGFYKKQYEVHCDLLESEGISARFRPEMIVITKPKYYIMQEYFRYRRQRMDMTQKALSVGVCEPETYSRIETGKRAPSRRNLEQLTDKLGITWCFLRSEIVSYEPKAFQLKYQQRIASIEGRDQESLELLHELEACLDMSIVENHQYIKSAEYVMEYRRGILDKKEALKKLEDLLRMTQEKNEDMQGLVYYTQTELEIIGHMLRLYNQLKQYQEGLQLVLPILKQMQHSKLDLEYQWSGFSFILRGLSSSYFRLKEYETSLEIARYVKTVLTKLRQAESMPIILDNIGDALEHMDERYSDEYKKLYRHTYYVADFYSISRITGLAKNYYEDYFEKDMIWYD